MNILRTPFFIKCVMCKADFNQDNCRSRFCEDCRSRKNRSAREDFYKERQQRRKEYRN
jgi:hypothetical protein